MGMVRALLPLVAMLAMAAPASASVYADAGLVEVHVVDRFDAECGAVSSTVRACMWDADLDGNDPSAWSVDAYQRVEYVGVATNLSAGDEVAAAAPVDPGVRLAAARDVAPLRVPLLADESLVVDLRDLHVRHPVFALISAQNGTVAEAQGPTRGVVFVATSDRHLFEAWYAGPSAQDPQSGVQPRHYIVDYSQDGLEYDRVSYDPDIGSDTLRKRFAYEVDWFGQRYSPTNESDAAFAAVRAAGLAVLPDVRYGVDFHAAQVAQSPDALAPPAPPLSPPEGPLAWGIPESSAAQSVRLGDPARPGAAPAGTPPLKPRSGGHEPSAGPAAAPQEADAPRVAGSATAPPRAMVGDGVPRLAAASAGAAVLSWLLLALYRKIRRDDVLNDPKRQRILALVSVRPGVSVADAADFLSLPYRTVDYHVGVLARAGLLVARRELGVRRLFPPSSPEAAPGASTLAAALEHPVSGPILAAVSEARGPVARSTLHECVEAPRSTVNWHIRRLTECGIIESNDEWVRAAVRVRVPRSALARVRDVAAQGARGRGATGES